MKKITPAFVALLTIGMLRNLSSSKGFWVLTIILAISFIIILIISIMKKKANI